MRTNSIPVRTDTFTSPIIHNYQFQLSSTKFYFVYHRLSRLTPCMQDHLQGHVRDNKKRFLQFRKTNKPVQTHNTYRQIKKINLFYLLKRCNAYITRNLLKNSKNGFVIHAYSKYKTLPIYLNRQPKGNPLIKNFGFIVEFLFYDCERCKKCLQTDYTENLIVNIHAVIFFVKSMHSIY